MWGDYHLREAALYVRRTAEGLPYLTFFGPRAQREDTPNETYRARYRGKPRHRLASPVASQPTDSTLSSTVSGLEDIMFSVCSRNWYLRGRLEYVQADISNGEAESA